VQVHSGAGNSAELQNYVNGFIANRFEDTKAHASARSCLQEEKLKTLTSLGESQIVNRLQDAVYGKTLAKFVQDMNNVIRTDEQKVNKWGAYAYNTIGHMNALTTSRLTALKDAIQAALPSNYNVMIRPKTMATVKTKESSLGQSFGGSTLTSGSFALLLPPPPPPPPGYAEVIVCAGTRLLKYNILITTFTSATAATQALLFSRVAAQQSGHLQYRLEVFNTKCIPRCVGDKYTEKHAGGTVSCSGSFAFGDHSLISFDDAWNAALAEIEPKVRGAINNMRFDIANGN
jgi:hypothetical protein